MKKELKKLNVVPSAIVLFLLLCLVASAFVYMRPLTIEQRYPALDLSECILIRGYFYDGTDIENTAFTISPDDPHFSEMIELFSSARFKTRLQNILPQRTKTHSYADGDYKWDVMFYFGDTLSSSEERGNRDSLHVKNFFGDISLSFEGKQVECSIKNQKRWLEDVMSIVVQHSD